MYWSYNFRPSSLENRNQQMIVAWSSCCSLNRWVPKTNRINNQLLTDNPREDWYQVLTPRFIINVPCKTSSSRRCEHEIGLLVIPVLLRANHSPKRWTISSTSAGKSMLPINVACRMSMLTMIISASWIIIAMCILQSDTRDGSPYWDPHCQCWYFEAAFGKLTPLYPHV